MHKKNGSALLIVFLLTSLLVFAALNTWRFVIVGIETSITKQISETQQQARQGIINWILKACERNFEVLLEQVPLHFYINDKKNGKFKISLEKSSTGLLLMIKDSSDPQSFKYFIQKRIHMDKIHYIILPC